MKSVRGKVAAITGAGSGIGRAVALRLAREGCAVAISDVSAAGLAETEGLVRAVDVRVLATRVDVADRTAVHAWADDVARAFGQVNIIINNAGVALGATVEDMQYADLEWLMNVNFWGVVHGTKAFLPHLRASGDGHVVNVSSVFGLIAVPTQGAYNAAKFAVRGFTEALRQELDIEGAAIGVTCVHPGGVKTNIARAARYTARDGWIHAGSGAEMEKLFKTSPDQAAADILHAILNNRRRQLIGTDATIIDAMQRMMPGAYQWLLTRAAKKRLRLP